MVPEDTQVIGMEAEAMLTQGAVELPMLCLLPLLPEPEAVSLLMQAMILPAPVTMKESQPGVETPETLSLPMMIESAPTHQTLAHAMCWMT